VEVTAAISLATDLGTGQPMEHALRTCLLALRAAEALGFTPPERSVVLHSTLLRFLGCTSDASDTARLAGGDEIAFNAMMAPMVMADDRDGVPYLLRHLGEELPLGQRVVRVASALSDPGGKSRSLTGHCEVGARLATRIGLPVEVVDAVSHAYERWDGKGLPAGVAGSDAPQAMRIAVVARDFELMSAQFGLSEAFRLLSRRRGRAYDPSVVDLFASEGSSWLASIDQVDTMAAVLDAEGDSAVWISADRLDDVLLAFADFTDLKSTWFRGHSRGVAELAGAAALAAGLDDASATRVRQSGLVHDLGVVGVPAGVWDRQGALGAEAWERVRLHPYLSERILGRCGGLTELAAGAGAHHERLDGSGYHRGSTEMSPGAQVLAAADVYRALGEDRPHRSRFQPAAAAAALDEMADAGALARRATDAVLSATGHLPAAAHVERPAGLTEREVDILQLISRGQTNKQMAAELGISPKTVGTHIEHIYAKAGVATRAGATLFAMENNLLNP
jgi:HD-GYP domain-containing protein (c-di-GMP phosphodiesterase class II)